MKHEKENSHDHEHCSHGHTHNHHIRRRVLGRIQNETAKQILSATLRIGGLLICPGDDIAAAGLAAFYHQPGEHEMPASLPPRASIEREVIIFTGGKHPKKKRTAIAEL